MNNQTIIDVRTPEEFATGHNNNAINIPLNEIPLRMEEIRSLPPGELIICCASGMRSAQAAGFLQSQQVACRNGGSWKDL